MAKTAGPKLAISAEAVDALYDLAAKMTAFFQEPGRKCVSLNAPRTLTVTLAGRGYIKQPHVGGEEFALDSVHVGAASRGHHLIFAFKPVDVAKYATMEMTQDDCAACLTNWRQHVDAATGGNFYMALEQVRNIDLSQAREAERQRQTETYGDFGSW